MRYTVLPVITADELNNGLELQFKAPFDVRTLFWNNFTNGTCMRLNFRDYSSSVEFDGDIDELKRRVVCGFLRDYFSNYDEIILLVRK